MGKKRAALSQENSEGKKKRKRHEQQESDLSTIPEQSDVWERASLATTIRVEEDFPRGGEELITPLERRKIRHQAQRDDQLGTSILDEEDLFPLSSNGHEVKKKDKKGTVSNDTVLKKSKVFSYLNPKHLVEGLLVLGAVREIQSHRLIMSLPFNMTGSVNIGNISDPLARQIDTEDEESVPDLTKLFYIGQILPCYVLEAHGNTIQLALNPRLINSNLTAKSLRPNMVILGCVQSVEDHGFIIDFGIAERNGFLLKKNCTEFIKLHHHEENGSSSSLSIGQIVSCCIIPGPEARALPVSINPTAVSKALVSPGSLFSLTSLLPGLLVNATIKEATPDSLVVSYLGGFEGVINLRHLPDFEFSVDRFPVNKKLKARLLWVDVMNKRTGLSLQKELVTGTGYGFTGMEIGTIFHDSSVVHLEPRHGIVLKLPNGTHGYAPLRLMYDEKADKVQKVHSVGSHHSCRIVQFNLLDGLAIVSLQDSVLEKPFMKLTDVQPGSLVEGAISRVTEKGVYVRLNEHFDGFVPESQLADTGSIKRARKKLVEGVNVKCRVLLVNPSNRFVMLTHKKSLVSSKLPPLTDLKAVQPGQVYDGQIASVQERGVVVKFFNGVCGFVPKMELGSDSAQVVLTPQSSFVMGQVVRCRVMSMDADNNKLKLSLRLEMATPTDSTHIENKVSAGEVLDLEVSGVAGNGISLIHQMTGELVFVPLECLSDYPFHCSELLFIHGRLLSEATDRGDKYILKEVLILSEATSSCPALGTTKSLLIQAVKDGNYPKTFTEMKEGMMLPGVIKKTYSYGCFVEFPNGLVGLVPIRFLSDEFLSESTGVYKDMQTVIARVQEKDEDKERILLSLRSSDLRLSLTRSPESTCNVLMQYFSAYLQEKNFLLTSGSNEAAPTHYKPGAIVTAQVTAMSQSLMNLVLANGATAKAYVTMATGVGVAVDDHVTCCVLDSAVSTGLYWVSLNPKIITQEHLKEKEPIKKPVRHKEKKIAKYQSQFKLEVGHTVSAVLEHVTPQYVLCTASTLTGSVLVYGLFDSGQWGAIPYQLKHLKPGHQVNGTVISSSSSAGNSSGLPIVVLGDSKVTRVSRAAVAKQQDVAIGDIIEVKVNQVLPNQLNVSCGQWRGRIHVTMLKDDLEEHSHPLTSYSIGDVMKARIINCKSKMSSYVKSRPAYLELTTKQSLLDAGSIKKDDKTFSVGEKVMGVVKEVTRAHLVIDLTPDCTAFVPVLFTPGRSSDQSTAQRLTKCYTVGQAVQCTVGEIASKKFSGETGRQYYASLLGTIPTVTVGDTVNGSITGVLPSEGLLVNLDHFIPGLVDIVDICDYFVANPLQYFNIGDKYSFHVVGKSPAKILLSLRQSHLGEILDCLPHIPEGARPDREITNLSELHEGEIVRGYVKAVTDCGTFVKLGREVVGRVMIKNLSDRFINDYQSCVSIGELVRAKILKIDEVCNQVELSLKLSDIDSTAAERLREIAEAQKKARKGKKRRKRMVESSSEDEGDKGDEENIEVEMEEEEKDQPVENKEIAIEKPAKRKKQQKTDSSVEGPESISVIPEEELPPLPVSGGFDWELTEPAPVTADNEEEVVAVGKKKSKRQKKAIQKAEELRLYQKEHLLLDTSRVPESPDDFDRLLVAHPNSSALWLQFMAYYLHTAEVDKARSVAERGLTIISFREEQEKLNLWVGLLNLENLYGTQESLLKVFQRAVRENESLSVYYRLASIYESSNKIDLADQLYHGMTKKFSDDVRVWTKYGSFLMEHGRVESARGLLQRSLKCLSKKQHVEVICKFAQYEFKYGETERGCTMFESLVSSYPRKVDLWSVYVDMLIKKEEKDRVRDIFERAISLKLSVKKMKFLFKRYLEFEKNHGSTSQMAAVHSKAKAYIESRTSGSTD